MSLATDALASLSKDGLRTLLLNLVDHAVRAINGGTDAELLQGVHVGFEPIALVVRVADQRATGECTGHIGKLGVLGDAKLGS